MPQYDLSTIKKIYAAFTAETVQTPGLEGNETYFIPKDVHPVIYQAGLEALNSLIAVENAPDDAHQEQYRGVDLGEMQKADEIAGALTTIEDSLKVAEAYDITDQSDIIRFIPKSVSEEQLTTARQILGKRFTVIEENTTDFGSNLTVGSAEQAAAKAFVNGEVYEKPDQTPIMNDSALTEQWHQLFETDDGRAQLEEHAKALNKLFIVQGDELLAKPGTSADDIKNAENILDQYFMTAPMESEGVVYGLKPANEQESGRAYMVYDTMNLVQSADLVKKQNPALEHSSLRRRFGTILNRVSELALSMTGGKSMVNGIVHPNILNMKIAKNQTNSSLEQDSNPNNDNPQKDVDDFLQNMGFKVQNTVTPPHMDSAPIDKTPAQSINHPETPQDVETPARDADKPVDNPQTPTPQAALEDIVSPYLNDINNLYTIPASGYDNDSDENELLQDVIRFSALRQTGYDIPGFAELSAEQRSASLDAVIGALKNRELTAYEEHLNDAKKAVFDILPAGKIVGLYNHIRQDLKRRGLSAEKREELTGQLNVIDNRLDEIVTDYIEGNIHEDPDKMPEIYNSMRAVLSTRDSQNPDVVTAQSRIENAIASYDHENNLTDLTQKADRRLSNRIDSINVALTDVNLDDKDVELRALRDALQFADDNGNVIPFDKEHEINPNLSALYDLSKTATLVDLSTSNEPIDQDLAANTAADHFKIVLSSMIAADLQSRGENGSNAPQIVNDMLAGKRTYTLPQSLVGAVTGHLVDKNMAFLDRLATKVGRDSAAVKKLAAPLNHIDELGAKRFGNSYLQARGLGKITGKNLLNMGVMVGVSIGAMAVGGPLLAAGIAAGVTAVRFWKMRRTEKRLARLNDQQKPKLRNFLNRNKTTMAMSVSSVTALSMGLPALSAAVMATNVGRSSGSTYRQSLRAGFSGKKSFFRSLTGLLPTAFALGISYFAGTHIAEASTAAYDHASHLFMDTPAPSLNDLAGMPQAGQTVDTSSIADSSVLNHVQAVHNGPSIEMPQMTDQPAVGEDMLAHSMGAPLENQPGEDMLGHSMNETTVTAPAGDTAPADSTDGGSATPNAATNPAPQQNAATTKLDVNTPVYGDESFIPMAEEVPETAESMQQNGQNIPLAAEVAETNAPTIQVETTHHVYSDRAYELAHARIHGEGLYDAHGHPVVQPDYTAVQMDKAVATIQGLEENHAAFTGEAGRSNAEILMYKLNQAHALIHHEDVITLGDGSKITAGEMLGHKMPDGQIYTPNQLRADLLAGREVNPAIATEILGKVENVISDHGHFIKDIQGFNETGTVSYRPDGNPGYTTSVQTHEVPHPNRADQPVDQTDVIAAGQAQTAPVTDIPSHPVVEDPAAQTPSVATPQDQAQPVVEKEINALQEDSAAAGVVADQPVKDAVTQPENSSARWYENDKLLFFVPFDTLWKAKRFNERADSLATKTHWGTEQTPADKPQEGHPKSVNPAGKEEKKTPEKPIKPIVKGSPMDVSIQLNSGETVQRQNGQYTVDFSKAAELKKEPLKTPESEHPTDISLGKNPNKAANKVDADLIRAFHKADDYRTEPLTPETPAQGKAAQDTRSQPGPKENSTLGSLLRSKSTGPSVPNEGPSVPTPTVIPVQKPLKDGGR